jgi:hypothetical protein
MTLLRTKVLPYAALIVPIVLMALLSVHTLTSIYQDIGRHITLGRIIWETGSVPSTNLFSYTAPDFPFINHHWLAEVLLYWGECAVGMAGLIVVKAVLIAGAFGLALAAAWRRHLALPGLVLAFVAMLIMAERTDVRPEVLSFLFLAWFLFVLYRHSSFDIRHSTFLLWSLPLVQLVWVNSHIYFFMGPTLFAAFLIGEFAKRKSESQNPKSQTISFRDSKLEFRTLLIIGALVVAATFANPNGIQGATYPLKVFGNYGYSVMENKGPFFLAAWGYPQMTSYALYAGILLTGVTFVYARRHLRQHVVGIILYIVTAAFALTMVRNFPLFALTMMPVALRNLELGGWRDRKHELLAGALLILTLFGVSVVTNQVYTQARIGKRFGLIVPEGYHAPVDFFRGVGIKGPIFNNFDIGSYLIWKLPEEKVFVDGRPEAYPAGFLQDVYIKMQEDEEAWVAHAETYGINAIFWNTYDITPWSQTFEARIRTDKDWVSVYDANGILILIRDTPQNASVITRSRI